MDGGVVTNEVNGGSSPLIKLVLSAGADDQASRLAAVLANPLPDGVTFRS